MLNIIEYVANQLANCRVRLTPIYKDVTKEELKREAQNLLTLESLLREQIGDIRDLLKKLEGDE